VAQGWSRRRICLVLVIGLPAFAGVVYLGVELGARVTANYTRIDDGLYLGGHVKRPPLFTRAVLNLCEKPDPYRSEVHVWEPIPDGEPAPGIDWLRRQVNFIDAQRRSDRVVYVHCRAGVSRSGMVVVAYFMHKNRWPREQALAFVRARRSVVRPNEAFMEQLSAWERVVLGE
jgi:atypical dual specificity phosphatase